MARARKYRLQPDITAFFSQTGLLHPQNFLHKNLGRWENCAALEFKFVYLRQQLTQSNLTAVLNIRSQMSTLQIVKKPIMRRQQTITYLETAMTELLQYIKGLGKKKYICQLCKIIHNCCLKQG